MSQLRYGPTKLSSEVYKHICGMVHVANIGRAPEPDATAIRHDWYYEAFIVVTGQPWGRHSPARDFLRSLRPTGSQQPAEQSPSALPD
jgi:hypothetical protein